MNLRKQNWLSALLFGSLILLTLAGCGGSGASERSTASTTITIPGIATKGPIAGAKVSAYFVEADGKKGRQLGKTVISGADGKYSIEIPAEDQPIDGPIMVEVVGGSDASYVSESTGKTVAFKEGEILRAVTTNPGNNISVTVSPFTEAGYQKALQLVMQSPKSGIESAIEKGNSSVGDMHKISDILASPSADTSYSAALLVADKIIQSTASADTTTLTEMIAAAARGTSAAMQTEYVTAMNTAAQSLPSTTPGLSATIGALGTFLQDQSKTSIDPAPPATPVFTLPYSSTSDTVTITWSASTSSAGGGLSYYLYRNGTFINNTQSLTFTDTGLQPSTSYKYEVKALDANSKFSLLSDPLTATTVAAAVIPPPVPPVTTPPTTPASLTIASQTTSSASLSWGISTGEITITGYEIYRNGSKIGTATTNSYTDTGLVVGGTYVYKVKAVNANGISSEFSSSVSVTIISNPVLATPITVTTGGSVQ